MPERIRIVMEKTMKAFLFVGVFFIGAASMDAGEPARRVIDFNRDVRPILSNNCFVCHGPDNNLRKADLRLDLAKEAWADRGGYKIFETGKPEASEFYKRLVTPEKSKRMPPAKSKKELKPEQIETLRLWIEQGAKYQEHWSLIPPRVASPPPVKNKAWVANPIDSFILSRLESEGLKPSPAADRRTLLRRLSFDLVGLPPTPEEVDAFVADQDAAAYEKAVDRLLASPHFGERLALHWLDLVRYADTAGYHSDNHRDVYLYRDWVIKAFNDNMPFDRFTIEQLAGDLLPSAGNSQKIASGYNRLLQTTEEGGAQAKEYQAKYYADRVRNFSTVWLGLTLGCTECHDHKYDPFSTREFYQIVGFFADIQEVPVGRQKQTPIMTPEQERRNKFTTALIDYVQKDLTQAVAQVDKKQADWEKSVRNDPKLPKEIRAILSIEPGKRNAKQKEALTRHHRGLDANVASLQKLLADAQQEKAELLKGVPTTLITTAVTPKTIRLLPRGNWLDDSGPIVQPGTPASLPALPDKKDRANRLDLARWLVAPDNPLTARVFVNRLWSLYFGQGIVKTLDDFGSQGANPTHPELLDWLAREFQSDWNIKKLIKTIVLSQTYRQSSQETESLRQRDPFNQLLARQARFRLVSEQIRDNALAVSGLLVPTIGGPSVKPYQPAGYWSYLNFPVREWQKDSGPNLYRRGLYTYWCRTFLQPSMLAFDASTREECVVLRPSSNTPQQALVLLNDPTYVEAARVLAEHILHEAKSDDARLQLLFRKTLQRQVSTEELKVLLPLLAKHRQQYAADAKSAQGLLRVGDRPAAAHLPAAELAAWTSVTRVVLNLHEFITRN